MDEKTLASRDELVAFRTRCEDIIRQQNKRETELVNSHIIRWLAECGVYLANRLMSESEDK